MPNFQNSTHHRCPKCDQAVHLAEGHEHNPLHCAKCKCQMELFEPADNECIACVQAQLMFITKAVDAIQYRHIYTIEDEKKGPSRALILAANTKGVIVQRTGTWIMEFFSYDIFVKNFRREE